jgi:cytolysin (calcineurin-like family phosphatase)
MFCVGLVVAGFAGVAAGFACAGGSTTEVVGLVVAGFADVVADIAGVGEPRRACSLFFFLLRFVYQV